MVRDAIGGGFRALVSRSADAKARAAQQLAALPMMGFDQPLMNGNLQVNLLALLGAQAAALKNIGADRTGLSRTALWLPSMTGAARDPAFQAAADRLGLMRYWKSTHTRPDICSSKGPPPFCRMI
jgi:hypothetical protein